VGWGGVRVELFVLFAGMDSHFLSRELSSDLYILQSVLSAFEFTLKKQTDIQAIIDDRTKLLTEEHVSSLFFFFLKSDLGANLKNKTKKFRVRMFFETQGYR